MQVLCGASCEISLGVSWSLAMGKLRGEAPWDPPPPPCQSSQPISQTHPENLKFLGLQVGTVAEKDTPPARKSSRRVRPACVLRSVRRIRSHLLFALYKFILHSSRDKGRTVYSLLRRSPLESGHDNGAKEYL